MELNETKNDTIQKSIKLEPELIEEIEKLGKEYDRKFAAQVRFMLKEYLRIAKPRG